MHAALGLVDLAFLVGSILLSALIGLYFTNKNNSLESYMRADGELSVVPVAISLMTSCMSGLTLLGSSAELYYQGPTYALVVFAMLVSGPIAAHTVVPIFYRMNELSLYRYLEKRYGLVIKYVISTIYILQMIFHNAVIMYLPAMALQSILEISKLYSILFIGLMCVIYSGIGGIKAVVWTDFFQAALMYASIMIVGIMGTYDAGGISNLIEEASEGQRLSFDLNPDSGFLSLNLSTRHTLFGLLVGSTIKHVYAIGVNQVQIQRALSLGSLRQAQRSFALCSMFTALISALSTYMGLVLYSAYRSCDPYLAGEIPRRDAIILHYVAHRLSRVAGLRGLFIAGLFSATLSSLSSYANSMAALALEDFVRPLRRRMGLGELSSRAATRLAKALTIVFGLLCVLAACAIEKSNSRLLQATTTMIGAIGVPFLAAFALGIFTRHTNTCGMLTGLVVALTLGTYVAIRQTFFGHELEPAMPVYYNQQCARVFNSTMDADQLPVPALKPFEPAPPLSLENISYMSLPIVQFALTIVVASVVSLLSGGWKQEVDDRFLVSILRRGNNKDKNCRGSEEQEEAQNGTGKQQAAELNLFKAENGSHHVALELQRARKVAVANDGGFISSSSSKQVTGRNQLTQSDQASGGCKHRELNSNNNNNQGIKLQP